jgi:3-dehydroquinate synthase
MGRRMASSASEAPMETRTVRVDVGPRSYDIVIGSGLLKEHGSYLASGEGDKSVLVTNQTLAPLLGERVRQTLSADGRRVEMVVLADGEEHKVWSTVQQILDAMLSMKCDRQTAVYALGGGVVGDISGFAAACYMRGVRYVQLPTTLLAQVDSSVGGKTGVNHAAGKNLIGAFHQPSRVIIDLDTLATLSNRQLVAGLGEVIKYGIACDETFLLWIESNLGRLLCKDPSALLEAVSRSCEIKARIVAADEHEGGARAILNFGHTFAHAIEAGAGYGAWLHGEAVGCGMIMAADLSARLGMIEPALVERVVRVVGAAGLPVRAPTMGAARYLELMRLDKKSRGEQLRFVLLQGAGRSVLRPVAPEQVAQTIESRATGGPEPGS